MSNNKQQELVALAQQGDARAFEQLVKTTSAELFALCFRILKQQVLAEEALQDTYIKVYRKLSQFRGHSFDNWLRTMAARTAIDIYRKQKKVVEDGSDDLDNNQSLLQTPQQIAEAKELRSITDACLESLSADVRIAFILRHYQELSIEHISEITDTPPNTVKNRIFRAVAQLRNALQPLRIENCGEAK